MQSPKLFARDHASVGPGFVASDFDRLKIGDSFDRNDPLAAVTVDDQISRNRKYDWLCGVWDLGLRTFNHPDVNLLAQIGDVLCPPPVVPQKPRQRCLQWQHFPYETKASARAWACSRLSGAAS